MNTQLTACLSVPILPLHNEKELLSKIAEADEKAFEAIVDHYWNKIYSIAIIFTKSPELAKDIIQDVFLKVWSKRECLPAIERFDSWLFIVARNEIFNSMRKKGPVLPVDLCVAEREAGNGLSPEESLDLKQLQELIKKGTELLPPQQKLIFTMSREQGISHEEICKELNLARSTVKNSLVKALNFLRNYVQLHANVCIGAIMLLLHLAITKKS
jgi:RNA polymerase sigma-70 factor (family 1)